MVILVEGFGRSTPWLLLHHALSGGLVTLRLVI